MYTLLSTAVLTRADMAYGVLLQDMARMSTQFCEKACADPDGIVSKLLKALTLSVHHPVSLH